MKFNKPFFFLRKAAQCCLNEVCFKISVLLIALAYRKHKIRMRLNKEWMISGPFSFLPPASSLDSFPIHWPPSLCKYLRNEKKVKHHFQKSLFLLILQRFEWEIKFNNPKEISGLSTCFKITISLFTHLR